jgi:hypothetical protein
MIGMDDEAFTQGYPFTSVGALALKVMDSVLERQVVRLAALERFQGCDRRARTSRAAMAPSRTPIPG